MHTHELDQITAEAGDAEQAYHDPSTPDEGHIEADYEDEEEVYTSETVRSIERKENLFNATMLALQDEAFSPLHEKVFERTWRIGKAAEMVGKTPQLIRLREKEGKLPQPEKLENGRYADYTLEDINRMRDFFGTRPSRGPDDPPAIVAFSTLKGGCGKSTLSVHYAQYMALKGYRVLMIDCDPQGSASTLFGLNPDLPAAEFYEATEAADDDEQAPISQQDQGRLNYSIGEYIEGFVKEFMLVIQGSYFPGIDLVPANLDLGETEHILASKVVKNPLLIDSLRRGILSVAHDYDVIVLDPPPALGLLSLSVMRAANALAIPMLPTTIDFASTAKYMSTLRSQLISFGKANFEIDYSFETILVNGVTGASAHTEIVEAMATIFGPEDMLTSTMKRSAEIDSAGKEMKTVYDLTGPMKDADTYNRSIRYLDAVFSELETRVRRTWPSHHKKLLAEAKI